MRNQTKPSHALKMNTREVAWLWYMMARDGINFEECQLDSHAMRRQLSEHLTEDLITNLEHAKDTQFIPEGDFKWVDKDGRQPPWLVRKSLKLTGKMLLPPAFSTLPIRQQMIAIFDIWKTSLSDKQRALNTLKHEWREHLLDDKLFNWMKGEEEQAKCSMAWEWMTKHQPQLMRRASPWRSHNELLEFFDEKDVTSLEKELLATKIRRRWSTKKTRENSTHKKQYNFVLTNDINSALNQLAKKHKISRTKVLEGLILQETAVGLYLDKSCQKP